MQVRWWAAGSAAAIVVVAVASTVAFSRESAAPVAGVRVVAAYPHDPKAFSQGLVVVDGQMYEGTGHYGQSSLRKVELASGRVEQIIPLNRQYFGEGITVLGDKLYQLTWKERLGIVYDIASFKPVGSFRYSGEGWGLTNDGTELILSDGSATLRFLSTTTFEVTRRVEVRSGRSRVDKLNELEFVNDEIWANIWYADRIARISPKTGEVLGWIDASTLYPANQRPSREHVMNGIAYDSSTQRLFLTGKNWPRLFEVEVIAGR